MKVPPDSVPLGSVSPDSVSATSRPVPWPPVVTTRKKPLTLQPREGRFGLRLSAHPPFWRYLPLALFLLSVPWLLALVGLSGSPTSGMVTTAVLGSLGCVRLKLVKSGHVAN